MRLYGRNLPEFRWFVKRQFHLYFVVFRGLYFLLVLPWMSILGYFARGPLDGVDIVKVCAIITLDSLASLGG